jgi:hypothetical protein
MSKQINKRVFIPANLRFFNFPPNLYPVLRHNFLTSRKKPS